MDSILKSLFTPTRPKSKPTTPAVPSFATPTTAPKIGPQPMIGPVKPVVPVVTPQKTTSTPSVIPPPKAPVIPNIGANTTTPPPTSNIGLGNTNTGAGNDTGAGNTNTNRDRGNDDSEDSNDYRNSREYRDADRAVKDATKLYEDSMKISAEELSTQGDLDRLIESTKKGYRMIKDKVIPMEFITGQFESVEERALNLAEPLESKLARLQAARTSSLEASKFALDRADKALSREDLLAENARKEKADAEKLVSGTSFYDPKTGEFKQAPSTTKAESFTLSPGEVRYDAEGNVIAKGGPKPMSDSAIEKANEKSEADQAKTNVSLDTANLVNQLLAGDFKGITGSGPFGKSWATQVGWSNQKEVNLFNQIQAQLALGARQLIKGSGAISDFEAKTLQSAASALGRNLSNTDFQNALLQIRGALLSNTGQSVNVRITDPNTGESDIITTTRDGISEAIQDGMRVDFI